MTARESKYVPETDFMAVRELLIRSYGMFEKPVNWRLERWNYARYFVAPMLGTFGKMEPTIEQSREAIRFLEDLTAVWKNEDGLAVAAVLIEHPHVKHPGFGQVFPQRYPEFDHLLPEMIDEAESGLYNPSTGYLSVYAYDHDIALIELLRKRSYIKDVDQPQFDSLYSIQSIPDNKIPPGYRIMSMAEDNNIRKRRSFRLQ